MAGIVLAAGSSTRMPGVLKQLLPYRGTTLVGEVVQVALRAGLDPVFVVTGHAADRVAAELVSTGARTVFNAAHDTGIRSSLSAGIAAVEPTVASAAVILLADEPDVDLGLVAQVVARWRDGDIGAARIRYRDRPGHPVLIDRSAFPVVSGPPATGAVWDALIDRGVRTTEIVVEAHGPADIDRPADYEDAVSRRATGC